jgi:hypothetical protein
MSPVVFLAALIVAQGGTETSRSGLTCFVIGDGRVQQELGLTEEQKVAVWDIRWKANGLLGDRVRENMKRTEAPEYRKELEATARINAAMVAELAGVMDRGQFSRYEQIRIQFLRDEALLDAGVQKALKMDRDQVEKIVSLFVGYLEENTRRAQEFGKLPFSERMRAVPRIMREDIERREKTLKQMGATLSDKQRAALDALRGPIFKPAGRERVGSLREQAPMPEAVRRR